MTVEDVERISIVLNLWELADFLVCDASEIGFILRPDFVGQGRFPVDVLHEAFAVFHAL